MITYCYNVRITDGTVWAVKMDSGRPRRAIQMKLPADLDVSPTTLDYDAAGAVDASGWDVSKCRNVNARWARMRLGGKMEPAPPPTPPPAPAPAPAPGDGGEGGEGGVDGQP